MEIGTSEKDSAGSRADRSDDRARYIWSIRKCFFKKATMASDRALDWLYTVAGWDPTLTDDVLS